LSIMASTATIYSRMRFGAIEKSATVMPLIRNAPPTCKDSLPS
jgi:hypothetical protein